MSTDHPVIPPPPCAIPQPGGGSAYINGEVVIIDGGDWLQGAGSFSFRQDLLSEADWQALRPRKRDHPNPERPALAGCIRLWGIRDG